eukprot:gene10086-7981_t
MEEASRLSGDSSQYVIQAPGPIYRDKRFIVSKFTQSIPDFHDPSNKWRLSIEKPEISNTGKKLPPKDGKPGELFSRGVPEGALQGAAAAAAAAALKPVGPPKHGQAPPRPNLGSNYFVFVRVGKTITAYPIEALYNFKPPNRRVALSLDEAEAQISRDKARLGAVSDGRRVALTLEEAEAQISRDKSRLGARLGGRRVALTLEEAEAQITRDKARLGAMPGGRFVPKSLRAAAAAAGSKGANIESALFGSDDDDDDAEDWDMENEHADDDEYMGDGEDSLEDDPGERKKLGLEDEEDEEQEQALGEDEKKLKKKLEEEAKAEDDEAGEEDEEDMEGGAGGPPGSQYEDVEEDLDLDEMANDLVLDGTRRGTTPQPEAAGKKSEPSRPPSAKRKPEGAADESLGAVKPPTGPAPTGPARSRNTTPVPSRGATPPPARKATPPPAAAPGKGPVTQAEVVDVLKTNGKVPLTKIRAMFQARLTTTEARDNFKKLVQLVGKLEKDETGTQFVVLKPGLS